MTTELPGFVLHHLADIAKLEGFESFSLSVSAGSKPGDGFMAVVWAVELSGPRRDAKTGATEAEGRLQLMCKLLPDNVQRQEVFKSKRLFEREVYVYDRLLPRLVEFQREKGLGEADGFFGFPQCYVAVADAERDEYAIVMRDLRAIGYQLWDKVRPMPVENVRLLFEQLGRLAGLGLVLRTQRPQWIEELETLGDLLSEMFDQEAMLKMCTESYEKTEELMEDEGHKRVLAELRDTWMGVIKECTAQVDRYSVIGHGDSWNNNMMFRGQEKICVLDWQVSRISSPALDIAYFFCSSTDKALRTKHLDELLHIYHDNLSAVCRKCGADPQQLMPFSELEAQLRRFGRFGLVMAPLLLMVIVSQGDDVVDMDEMAKELSAPSSDDAKRIELTKFNPESLAKFRQRLGDVIDDAKRLGWID